jgi:L-ribulose-5-phosphate 3-epimerase
MSACASQQASSLSRLATNYDFFFPSTMNSFMMFPSQGTGGSQPSLESAFPGSQRASELNRLRHHDSMSSHFLNRLGVCSWSLQPKSPEELIDALQQIGVKCLQIALDPIRENPDVWGKTKELCNEKGIFLVSGMFGTIGEDYTTMDSIKRTGGVVPDATWPDNWKNIQATADLAKSMNIRLVTFHAGFLPHDHNSPDFKKLVSRISQIADLFKRKGLELAFETGQEDADDLELFLIQLNRPNVGVNFDPANMILYDRGDPIDALHTLGKRLKQVHIKDAIRTKKPGEWGQEVPVGTGEVDWKEFFNALDELRFSGFCCIEREADNQRLADIKTARDYIAKLPS